MTDGAATASYGVDGPARRGRFVRLRRRVAALVGPHATPLFLLLLTTSTLGAGWGVWRWLRVAPASAGLESTVDSIVRAAMDAGPIAGVSVGISRRDAVVYARGYGFADLENRIPATERTIYRIGSIAKQFTAAAVMRLVEEGRLRLDAPIADYLGDDAPGYGKEVTVESLLNHTSGVPDYATMEEWWRTMSVELTPAELVGVFRDAPLAFRPGTAFSYSNSGYAYLGLLVERVSGQPYGGHLNERFFAPLDLASTSYCDDRALVHDRARGYQLVEGAYRHPPHLSMSQAYAAGGLCSNVLDLLRWSRYLSRGVAVAPASYERMVRSGALLDGSPLEYGYGLAVSYLDGHHRITHVGGTLGFSSYVAHYDDDDDLTIVVLTNTEGAIAAAIASDLARALLDLGERATTDLPLAVSELDRYTGRYDLRLTEVVVGRAKGGRLEARVDTPGLAGRYRLLYRGDHEFQAASDPEIVVRFAVEGDSARGLTLAHRGITLRGTRVEERSPGS